MKKVIICLFLFLFFSINIFAFETTTGYVYINGYYEEQESEIALKVWRETYSLDSDRIYHAGDIYLGTDPTLGEQTVFNWELSGNRHTNVTLTFTITPLQAFSNGTYYIPKHTVKMTDGVTVNTHEFANATTGSSPYPNYRQGSSGASSFIVNSAIFIYNEEVKKNHSKSGYCTLQVLEYDEDTAGNFDYVSYITVEFSPV